MFVMIIVMAACGVWLEMRVVNSCSPLGNLLERTKVGSALFSLGLSVLLGMFFGAVGLIVFVSGMLSTVVIQPWYAMRRSGVLAQWHAAKMRFKQTLTDRKDLYARRANQVFMAAKAVGAVVIFPFVVMGKILDFIDKMASKF
jgi:hypothetical protein